jgi:hypothetical protein
MEWLDLFCQTMGCSDHFREQAQRQLGGQFAEAVGTGIGAFTLVPPPGGASTITVDARGTARLDTDLVAADGRGYPVTIEWESPGPERVHRTDRGLTADSGPLTVRWAQLPAEELRSRYAGRPAPPWPTSPAFLFDPREFSFEVDWRPFPWPDVWLEVRTGRPAFPESSATLVTVLTSARERWNETARTDAGRGLIHNLGLHQQVVAPDEMLIDVDFGSAPPSALVSLLRALEDVAGALGLVRVTVRSARDG